MSDIEDKQTVITCIRRAINELRCALDGVTDEGLDFEELELRVGLARSYLQLADPIVKAAAAVINADDDEEPLPTPSDSAFHQHCVGVRCTRCGETVCEDDISLDWCETCWSRTENLRQSPSKRQNSITRRSSCLNTSKMTTKRTY